MVAAAWRALRSSPYWREHYEKFLPRMRRPNPAVVVGARKLLGAVWQVLSKEETDVHARAEALAYKILVRSGDWVASVRPGLTDKPFAKDALTLATPARAGVKLGVEDDSPVSCAKMCQGEWHREKKCSCG